MLAGLGFETLRTTINNSINSHSYQGWVSLVKTNPLPEEVVQRGSVKSVFLKIMQNAKQNTYTGVSL